jgi:low affinity Fe/Cu permease
MDAAIKFYRLHFLEKLAAHVTKAAGSSQAIVIAFTFVVLWLIAGPFLHFSDQWLWLISTTATVITFLMVFVIQKSQNKDSLAIQLKLNELIAAHELASNRLVDVENMTEEELKIIQKYYAKLSAFTKNEDNFQQSHSIDEIEVDHDIKNEMEKDLLAADLSRNY